MNVGDSLYDFYYPAGPNFGPRKYTIMPAPATLGYWMRLLKPIKIQRVR